MAHRRTTNSNEWNEVQSKRGKKSSSTNTFSNGPSNLSNSETIPTRKPQRNYPKSEGGFKKQPPRSDEGYRRQHPKSEEGSRRQPFVRSPPGFQKKSSPGFQKKSLPENDGERFFLKWKYYFENNPDKTTVEYINSLEISDSQEKIAIVCALIEAISKRPYLIRVIEALINQGFLPKYAKTTGKYSQNLMNYVLWIASNCDPQIVTDLINLILGTGCNIFDVNGRGENCLDSLIEWAKRGDNQKLLLDRYMSMTTKIPDETIAKIVMDIINKIAPSNNSVLTERLRYTLCINHHVVIRTLVKGLFEMKTPMLSDINTHRSVAVDMITTAFCGANRQFREAGLENSSLQLFFENHKCEVPSTQSLMDLFYREVLTHGFSSKGDRRTEDLEIVGIVVGCLASYNKRWCVEMVSNCLQPIRSGDYASIDTETCMRIVIRVAKHSKLQVSTPTKNSIETIIKDGGLTSFLVSCLKDLIGYVDSDPIVHKEIRDIKEKESENPLNKISFAGLKKGDVEEFLDDVTYEIDICLKSHPTQAHQVIVRAFSSLIEHLDDTLDSSLETLVHGISECFSPSNLESAIVDIDNEMRHAPKKQKEYWASVKKFLN